ncbi:MAG: zinc ribbon domain-containing protein [Planctomycetota bacterium]
MPTYVYLCEANGAEVEVVHPMADSIETWGELCERAGCDPERTPADAPVHRRIFAPAVRSVRGPAELKNLGLTKLVKRDSGVYENVTASNGEARYIDANDPTAAS